MSDMFIAHVKMNADGTWAVPHLLSEHLRDSATLTEAYAEKFHSGVWGRAAGLAHDAGKGRPAWQNYIRFKSGYGYDEEAHLEAESGKMPHAIHGAKLAEELFGKGIGRVLAYCIAGHHSGLPDWSSAEGAGQASLQFQQAQVKDLSDITPSILAELQSAKPVLPPWQFAGGLDLSLGIRMLYSSLVDADFLNTESYMDEAQANIRGSYCPIAELLGRFNHFIKRLDEESEDTRVNEIRRDIRKKCEQMAGEAQGIF